MSETMRTSLETDFDRRRLDYQPWHYFLQADQVPPEFELEQRLVQEILARRCGATFAGRCFVSARANVFTERLHMDDTAWIAAGAIVRGEVHLGHSTSINAYAHVAGAVSMGACVMVAGGAGIYGFDHGHGRTDVPMYHQALTRTGIVIEDDCWIGSNSVITDGVHLGAHSVVAAGAVVRDSFPPLSVVGGVPARLLRTREPA